MRVLVACEYSGRVREAFSKLGHEALSCDLLPAEDGGHHYQGDVREIMHVGKWDLMIAHPPCTYLCNSGVRWLFEEEGRWEKLEDAAKFFLELWNAPIPRIAIENPIMHKHGFERVKLKPDQIVHPWMFGEPESKSTGLYLKNLPKLIPTHRKNGDLFMEHAPENIQQSVHRMAPSEDRWKERSRTFISIAEAMADQWGSL